MRSRAELFRRHDETGKLAGQYLRDVPKTPGGDPGLVNTHFDFRLGAILGQFNLRHLPVLNPEGFYRRIAAYGHMGRDDLDLPWEKNTDKAELLASA